jgi:hypothetical protein
MAHGLPPEALEQITLKHQGVNGEQSGSATIACANCHREHQGAEFDLTAISDAACQSCHQRRYQSFVNDHPDFGAWPYERRTRIAFNHASHSTKHFAEKKQAFDCRSCHLDDATGQVQLLAGYDVACASCHDDKIVTSMSQGVPMLVLPTLDVEALKAAGHDIGPWPQEASGDFDGRLPPLMKLLLSADPAAASAIDTLGEDFEFIDIVAEDREQLAAAATLAKATRDLMMDLLRRGPIAWRERLARVLGRDVSDTELQNITAGLSAETMRDAVRAWFPHEDAGSADWNTTKASGSPKPIGGLDMDPAGMWQSESVRLSILYRPTAHADPVLSGALELLAATPGLAERPLALAMLKQLSSATAPGLCASCHSIEQSNGKIAINWKAYDRTGAPRELTKFSHGPHLVLPQLASCTHCHSIDSTKATAAGDLTWDPHSHDSDFAPLSKQQCAKCHTTQAAGDACQKCHNYHADEIEAWRMTASQSTRSVSSGNSTSSRDSVVR